MRKTAFFLFLLLPSIACAQGIGSSPSTLDFESRELIVFNLYDSEKEFMLISENLTFSASQNPSVIPASSSRKIRISFEKANVDGLLTIAPTIQNTGLIETSLIIPVIAKRQPRLAFPGILVTAGVVALGLCLYIPARFYSIKLIRQT